MIRSLQLCALALLAGASMSLQAAEGNAAAAAKDKISMCIGCHGIPGYRTTFPEVYKVPKLGGQHPAYIVNALNAYAKGERNHPTMVAQAKSFSAQDIADIAAYVSALKPAK